MKKKNNHAIPGSPKDFNMNNPAQAAGAARGYGNPPPSTGSPKDFDMNNPAQAGGAARGYGNPHPYPELRSSSIINSQFIYESFKY
jgi:hypothetical protein